MEVTVRCWICGCGEARGRWRGVTTVSRLMGPARDTHYGSRTSPFVPTGKKLCRRSWTTPSPDQKLIHTRLPFKESVRADTGFLVPLLLKQGLLLLLPIRAWWTFQLRGPRVCPGRCSSYCNRDAKPSLTVSC